MSSRLGRFGIVLLGLDAVLPSVVGAETPTYLTQWGALAQWGTQGSENGQFENPVGVAVDASGTVYVAANQNHRIQAFTAGGRGVAVDSSGNVYVADNGNHRIQKCPRLNRLTCSLLDRVTPRTRGTR